MRKLGNTHASDLGIEPPGPHRGSPSSNAVLGTRQQGGREVPPPPLRSTEAQRSLGGGEPQEVTEDKGYSGAQLFEADLKSDPSVRHSPLTAARCLPTPRVACS